MIAESCERQIDRIIDLALSFSKKDILPTVSEWAEANRYLSRKVTKKPGNFSFDYMPYTREIADCFSRTSRVRSVAVMKGVQLGFTTSIYDNAIGYHIAENPSGIMLVSSSKSLLKDYKKVKIDQLIDDSGLRGRIVADTGNKNSRRQGDTSTLIEFIGGFLRIVGAKSADDLKSFPIKILLLDELDAYPDKLPDEGDPVELAVSRADSFGKDKRIGYISTPLLKHSSRIFKYYEKGDKRKYYVPCPFCGEYQELIFYSKNGGLYPEEKGIERDGVVFKPYGLVFDTKECKCGCYDSVAYKCMHCGELINEYYKPSMLKKGYWKPTAVSQIPYFQSYQISALYSPAREWWEIVSRFLHAGNNPELLRVFYNLDLGLPFEDTTAGVNSVSITKLRDGKYNNDVVPDDALFLTAACDVQDNRLEVEIKAWGDRFRNWGINHIVIPGDTSNPMDPCWQELIDIKDKIWAGKQIFYMLIDSGDGEKTDLIYRFCEQYGEGIIFPLKGIGSTSKTGDKYKIRSLDNYSIKLVEIYVDSYKNQLAAWFNQEWRESDEDYPDGWATIANGYSDEYLRQLTTEHRVKKVSDSGMVSINWVAHGRNEAFDLNVYNLCAAELVISEISKNALNLPASNAGEVFKILKAA